MCKYKFDKSPHGAHIKIINNVERNKKVLDIGCATGYIGRELKRKKCYVVGIEIDKNAAKIAERYYDKVIIADIENVKSLPFNYEFFDVIIYGDILEHTRDPLFILKKFDPYLKKGGYIIASIPNITNWRIRLKILFGKFEYEETGILDKTHIRFFNLKTAKKLITNAGYKIEKIEYTGLASRLGIIGKFFPNLLAYQFIIKGRKI